MFSFTKNIISKILKKTKSISIKKWLLVFSLSVTGIFLTVYLSHRYIQTFSAPYIYTSTSDLPSVKVALLLGTSRTNKYGYDNLYFKHRIKAAYELYASGKIKKILVSGDNRFSYYNEPKDMHDELVKLGVPDSCIVYDYAGLRTFDSMVRCKTIFGQDSVIVVSQAFHNERAIYIGRKKEIVCFGYNAKDVHSSRSWFVNLREYFSRFKCLLDIHVLHTQPRHGGEKIVI
jgi:SanA protein